MRHDDNSFAGAVDGAIFGSLGVAVAFMATLVAFSLLPLHFLVRDTTRTERPKSSKTKVAVKSALAAGGPATPGVTCENTRGAPRDCPKSRRLAELSIRLVPHIEFPRHTQEKRRIPRRRGLDAVTTLRPELPARSLRARRFTLEVVMSGDSEGGTLDGLSGIEDHGGAGSGKG